MDRLHALRDTANLPRAIVPPIPSPHTSTSGMESSMNDSGMDMKMDDSLTDIHWLHRMDAGSEIPGFVHKVMRKRPKSSNKENQRQPSKEGCRKRLNYGSAIITNGGNLLEGGKERVFTNKPPLSYASLIVLAISSTPQMMLTLSGIYRWIESTFPFYRTPESKAWKNSIRHNLSIRKNMFAKVFQYPPRRGNGSYWTLLADGEEELKRAHPLFTTLLPPVIDADSAYCRIPLTHTVKSRGQFTPVLPHTNRKLPYFALNSNYFDSKEGAIDAASPILSQSLSSPGNSHEIEVVTATKMTTRKCTKSTAKCALSSSLSLSSTTPTHLEEHSYAKTVTFENELQQVEVELAPENLVEGSFILESADPLVECRATKRFCSEGGEMSEWKRGGNSTSGESETTSCHQVGVCDSTTDMFDVAASPRQCTTPGHPDSVQDNIADCSLSSLLNSSFLTPIKTSAMNMPDLALDAISFSPLYNFVTPQRGGTPPNITTPQQHRGTAKLDNKPEKTSKSNQNDAAFCTHGSIPPDSGSIPVSDSISPSHSHSTSTATNTGVSELDSGIFSPFESSLHFSTPLVMKAVSPLVDLPGNVFNTPQSSERANTPNNNNKVSSNSCSVSMVTPTRKTGLWQLSSVPNLTPSSRKT